MLFLAIKYLLAFILIVFTLLLSLRCYNCGEFANHIASKCTVGPQPKRCHHCKSSDHLIADCPALEQKRLTKKSNGDIQSDSTDTGKQSNSHSGASSEEEGGIFNAAETASSSSEKHNNSDSGHARSIGKTPTSTDDSKSETSATPELDGNRGRDV